MNVKIDNTSLKSYVYNEIKQMIYAGKFPLDQKINKAELAEHFNSSLTPINDALNRLVGEKFLTLESRKGYFVREFSVEEMIEFFEIRAGIEGMAIRLCAEKLTDEGIGRITSFFQGYDFPLSQEEESRYRQEDNHFHSLIVDLANNIYISDIMNSLGVLAKSYQKGLLRDPEETYPEHHQIMEALLRRDGDLAQSLMIQHHLATRNHLKKLKRM